MGEMLSVQNRVPRCFGCGPENPTGLKLRFLKEDDNTVSTRFTAPKDWTGFEDILHGGFQGLLLDETMAWAAWALGDGFVFITKEMTVRYLKPVHVCRPLLIIGRLHEKGSKQFKTRGEIRDEQGNLLTEAEGVFVRVSNEKFRILLGQENLLKEV